MYFASYVFEEDITIDAIQLFWYPLGRTLLNALGREGSVCGSQRTVTLLLCYNNPYHVLQFFVTSIMPINSLTLDTVVSFPMRKSQGRVGSGRGVGDRKCSELKRCGHAGWRTFG